MNLCMDFIEKGRILHCLLDEVREEFIEKNNLYEFIPDSPFRTQILKFHEDIILYKMIKDWPEICHYFDNILSEESAYGINVNDLKAWHNLLKNYFSQQPNTNQILGFLQQRLTLSAQKENNLFKRFLMQCKGAIINKIAYFKLRSTLSDLKNRKKLNTAINFFYTHVNTFLIK